MLTLLIARGRMALATRALCRDPSLRNLAAYGRASSALYGLKWGVPCLR